jgi:hypothetical protein
VCYVGGGLAEAQGDDDAAEADFTDIVSAFRSVEDPMGLAWGTLRQGYLRLRRGDLPGARAALAESLAAARDLGHTTFTLLGLVGCAAAAALDGRDEAAARLFGRVAPVLEAGPGVGGPTGAAAATACGPPLAALRARLEPAAFAAAEEAGRVMGLGEAIALGLRAITAEEPGDADDAAPPVGAHARGAG